MEAVSAEEIEQALLRVPVRERADLDFKRALYSTKTEPAKLELAKDVAAMANGQGGVIVIGIGEDGNAVANEVSYVPIDDREIRRMQAVIAANVFPYPQIQILPKEVGRSGKGFYLVVIPRSPLRPHAIPGDGSALRYPRRQDSGTGFLNESEVADSYRSRFRDAADQVGRLERVTQDGARRIELPNSEGFWLAMALVPNITGALELTEASLNEARSWFEATALQAMLGAQLSFRQPPEVTTRIRRLALSVGGQRNAPPKAFYAELHVDGAGFLARVHLQRPGAQKLEAAEPEIVKWAHGALHVLTQHALRTGVHGEAVVRIAPLINTTDEIIPITVVGSDARWGREPVSDQTLDTQFEDGHTINLDDCASSMPALLRSTRVILTDVFQAIGLPEVRAITADGRLDTRFFDVGDRPALTMWAEGHSVALVGSPAADS